MLYLKNQRHPSSHDQLSAIEQDQLRIAGLRFDGEDRSAESRFIERPAPAEEDDDADGDGVDWDDGNLGAHQLSVCEVHDDDGHRFDLWLHHVDSGCLFQAGTVELVAERCQFSWMEPGLTGPSALAEILDEVLGEA